MYLINCFYHYTVIFSRCVDHFRRRDQTQTGYANFGYDDVSTLIKLTICNLYVILEHKNKTLRT